MKALKIGDLTATTPIIQGGMGVGISLWGLASAVANEGGIGVISAAGLGLLYNDYSHDYSEAGIWGMRQEIRKAREASKGIIGVNIMVALSHFPELVRTAIEEKVDIIFAGAGLPLNLPSYLTPETTTKLVPIVSSARAAKIICTKWYSEYKYIPDAIVVEGPKAGGHLGFKHEQIEDNNFSLEAIVPQVVSEVKRFAEQHNCKIPIIAGGGVYSGEDIYRILSLGADAVQMGTRFVATKECDASETFKQAYINSEKDDIKIIQSPVGLPGRAIGNSFLDKVAEGLCRPKKCAFNCLRTCEIEKTPYCIMLALYNAYKGRMDHGYAFCGANAWRCHRILSVKELIESLRAEYKECAESSL